SSAYLPEPAGSRRTASVSRIPTGSCEWARRFACTDKPDTGRAGLDDRRDRPESSTRGLISCARRCQRNRLTRSALVHNRCVGVRPLFVLGSPRSGTPMLGNYL